MSKGLIAAVVALTTGVTGLSLTQAESGNFQKGSEVVIAAAREMNRPRLVKVPGGESLYDKDDCGYIEKYQPKTVWGRIVMQDICIDEKERRMKHPESEEKKKVAEMDADLAEFDIYD